MSFNNTILAIEMENLQRRENEMFIFYSELLKELKDNQIKKDIEFIRIQELAHIKMATEMISILFEYIKEG
jgi:rubrerythrin